MSIARVQAAPRAAHPSSALIVTSLAAALLALAGRASAAIYSGAGGVIPDAIDTDLPGSITYTINVTDAGFVGSFNGVQFTNLAHNFLGDLTCVLTAPNGLSVTIFDRIGKTNPEFGFGDSSNFFGSYAFKDGGSNIWAIAGALNGSQIVPGGIYSASAPLTGAAVSLQNAFAGTPAQGQWKVTFMDYGVGESGSFSNWFMDLTLTPIPGPSGALLLLLAGYGARRRTR
jgi:hypothetical protein